MILGMAVGATIGAKEGPFIMATHGYFAAIGITIEVVAFTGALLISATRGTFDAFLFMALAFYTMSMALGVPLLSMMSIAAPARGNPPPWMLQLQPIIFETLMLGLALLRLYMLRKGLRVRDVLGPDSRIPLRFLLTSVDPTPRSTARRDGRDLDP